MSSQWRRGRGKRPRAEEPPPVALLQEPARTQSLGSMNYPPQSDSNYSNAGFTRTPMQLPISNARPTGKAGASGTQLEPLRLTTQPPPGKVAIPPLITPQSVGSSSKSSKKGRTAHACDHCRKAKAGCTGGQPCQRCQNAGVTCIYGDGKRDKERK